MIKKIPTSDLRLKMYVYDLNCDWTNHPFALREFYITSQEQIDEIVRAGIETLYIDTSKGVDVAGAGDDDAPDSPPASPEEPVEYKTKPLLEALPNAIDARKELGRALSHAIECVRQGEALPMEEVNGAMEKMAHSFVENADASIALMCTRKVSAYLIEHAINCAILMMAFEKSITYDVKKLTQVGVGGLLMDIGKVKLPHYIVEKTSRLTGKEQETIARHVPLGCEILSHTPDVSGVVLQIVAEHHERMDGSGYPAGKKGDEISLYGQMAAIVDVYDSLTAERVYKRGITPHAALNRLMRDREHYSHELVQQFIHCIGVYPIGSLVALSDGHFAVVIESEGRRILCPKVRVIYNLIKQKYVDPEDLDISVQENQGQVKIVGAVDPRKWNIKPERFLDTA